MTIASSRLDGMLGMAAAGRLWFRLALGLPLVTLLWQSFFRNLA